MRRELPRFQDENFERNLALVARVEEVAAHLGCSPAQLALAWVLAQGEDVVPIPGTKRRKYLEENVGALAITLTAEEVEEIATIIPPDTVAGSRYGETMMGMVNR
jgi:aryl-alcohol dehydrogenase-like predicted oxidoreductase